VSDLVACPACCASMDPVVADSVAYPSSPGTDSVSRPERVLYCPACGLGIAWPRISDAELDAYYTQGGYWDATGEPELLVPKLHPGHFALAQARWAFAQSAMSSGPARLSVLDIGAGHANPMGTCAPRWSVPGRGSRREELSVRPRICQTSKAPSISSCSPISLSISMIPKVYLRRSLGCLLTTAWSLPTFPVEMSGSKPMSSHTCSFLAQAA